MIRFLKLVFCCVLMFGPLAMYAQTPVHPKPPKITPVSPNAAEFAKYAESQMNLSTGANNVNIPLFNFEVEGLNIPINLSYSGTAIRVDQIAGTFGLGWVLNAGGLISLSKEDGGGKNTLMDINYGLLTSEYDLNTLTTSKYNYNFNGYSGQFCFNVNGGVVNLGDPRLKIVSSTYGFKITTPDGVSYIFGEEDTYTFSTSVPPEYINRTEQINPGTYTLDMRLSDYMAMNEDILVPNLFYNHKEPTTSITFEINQWLLRKIVFPNSNEIIEFNYDFSRIMGSDPDQYSLIEEYSYVPVDASFNNDRLEYIHRAFTFSRSCDRPIESIIWSNGKIMFDYTGRQDIATYNVYGVPDEGEIDYSTGAFSSALALERMKIYDSKNEFIKGFEFQYKYSNSSSSDPLAKRLLLSSVNEYSLNLKVPPYVFSYGFDMPHLLSNAQDFFGYYNGRDLIGLGPALYQRVNIMHKIPYLTNLGPGRSSTLPMNQSVFDNYLNSLDINPETNPSAFLLDLGFARQTESVPNLYYLRNPTEDMKVGLLERVEYPTGGVDAFSYTVDTVNYFYKGEARALIGGGVKLQSVYRTYGLGNQFPTEKKYFYENGKLLYLPFFSRAYFEARYSDIFFIRDVFYGLPINPPRGSTIMFEKVTEVVVNAGKTVSEFDVPSYFGSNSNSRFTIDSRAPELITILRSESNYSQYAYKLDWFPYRATSNYEWANGKLLKQTTYNQSNKKVEEITNEYEEVGYGEYNCFDISLLNDVVKKLAEVSNGLDAYNDGVFRLSKSHLISAWRPLTLVTKKSIDPNDINKYVTEISEYKYNVKNQLVKTEKKTNSDGIQYITKKRYPLDIYYFGINEEAAGYESLQNKNMINTEIEASSYICNPFQDSTKYLLSSYLTFYKDFNGRTLPWKIKSLEPISPLSDFTPVHSDYATSEINADNRYETERVFTQYNDRGKLVEMFDKNDGYVSYKYGYEQNLPIAQIRNSRTSLSIIGYESSFIGFESGRLIDNFIDEDFWAFNHSKVSFNFDSFTGKYALKVKPHNSPFLYKTFERSGPMKKILVSGWVKICQDEYFNIQPKEFIIELTDNDNDIISSVNLTTNSNMSEWKYFCVLLNPVREGQEDPNTSILYKVKFKNPFGNLNYDLLFDDIRVQPQQSSMSSYTYNEVFDLPTSISDDKNIPTHYEYDEIGRLSLMKDYRKNILKTNVYMYSPKK